MAWLPWALAAVFLLLVAAGGAWLLLAPGDDTTAADTPAAATTQAEATTDPATASTEAAETPSPTPEPSPIETIPAGDPVDVAAQASAQAPSTAPANQDVAGNPVTYVAGNMLDGLPDTCWRMPGDGTGTELTFTLAAPTTLTRVGMINGYAKTAAEGGRKLNWYIGNRRVLAATWIFDDGTEVAQPLGADQADADHRHHRGHHLDRAAEARRGQRTGHGPLGPQLHRRQRGHPRRHPRLTRQTVAQVSGGSAARGRRAPSRRAARRHA